MKLTAAILFLILASVQTSAQELYADITFDVSETGAVHIKGTTNSRFMAERTTQEFTSKKGQHWLLNITANETFSDIVYAVYLPENSEINYAKTSGQFRIGAEGKRPFVKGTGKNHGIKIVVQYTIPDSHGIPAWATIAAAAGGLAILAAIIKLRKVRAKTTTTHSIQSHGILEAWYDKSTLTERQRLIIDAIEKSPRPLTQKELEQQLHLPKSSLSRNVESLARAGLIQKEARGMSNFISISPKKPEP
ncbi:MarR family transcriptional regulator [Candidatus Woesearchaeota archaeon]|nr:MarR family transcriptional regulator [Candidatus Woesearchaeota archaeon]